MRLGNARLAFSRSRIKLIKLSLTLYSLQRSENRRLVGDGIIPFND
jgi:hypothetical protein